MHSLIGWLRAWLLYALFLLVNGAFTMCRNVVWRCRGIRGTQHQPDGGTKAHRMNIHFKHMIDIVYPISLSNFVLTHQDFVKPEYVLCDTVTLLQVTKDTAIFIEGKKGMPPAFSMSYSFATIGQMVTGESIIVMPLSVFLRLSEEMENLSSKTVFLYNTSRCGGTLVTSMLERTCRVVAWNEPRVLDNITRMANHAWNRKMSKRVLLAAVKMLTKPYSGLGVEPLAYVIKMCATYCASWRTFRDVAPEATQLFLYRDLNAAAQSQQRIITTVPLCLVTFFPASLTGNPHALSVLFSAANCPGRGFSDMPARYNYVLEWSYRIMLINYKAYLEMLQNGFDTPAFKYEDLLANPKAISAALLKAVGIPENLASLAMTAMEQDSQAKVPFSQEAMAAKKAPVDLAKLPSEFLDAMQEEFSEAGVPGPYDWNKGYRLPGTVIPVAN